MMSLYIIYFFLITICKANYKDIILEYNADFYNQIKEQEIERIVQENKLEIHTIFKIIANSNKLYVILKFKSPKFSIEINKIKETLKKESKGHYQIIENKLYEEKEIINNYSERNLDFLNEEEEKNNTLKNYMSTKYLFWNKGIKGKDVKIGIFDSGLSNEHSKCNLVEYSNFTEEDDKDLNGHGTHITSLICHDNWGISPEAKIFSYKVFDKNRRTTTSWLMQAMNKAQDDNLDIINFSFGGINFNDRIISEKVKSFLTKIEELVSGGIMVVASAGNDGPSYGTINFPGNLPFVITVGACNEEVFTIADISSRGPSILKSNLLINKPNTWAPGINIPSMDNKGNIQYKSGSSISTAIVTGYLSLLLSKFYEEREFFNVGNFLLFIKESNINLPGINSEELPSGLFNPDGLFKITEYYIKNKEKLNIFLLNDVMDFSYDYYSNYTISKGNKEKSRILFYSSMQPVYFSLSFINPNSKHESISKINHIFHIEDMNRNSTIIQSCINLEIISTDKDYLLFKEFIGIIQLKLSIINETKCRFITEKINWSIYFKEFMNNSTILFKLNFDIIPTPNRYNRILIDRFHNLFYPFDGYIAKDNLLDNSYSFDWNYESISTNYFNLYLHLKQHDYFVEELNESFDCIDLSEYAVLILLDEEKSLTDSEINRLKYEYEESHLSIFFLIEWNDPFYLDKIIIYDNETYEKLNPLSLGAEFYSINKLLNTYGIEIGHDTISFEFKLKSMKLKMKSGSSIAKFPANSYLYGNDLKNDKYLLDSGQEKLLNKAVLGLVDKLPDKFNSGRMAIFTDSYCVDDYQMKQSIKDDNCFVMISSIMKFLIHGKFIKNEFKLKDHNILESDFVDIGRNAINGNDSNIQNINQVYSCENYNYSSHIVPKNYKPFKYIATENMLSNIPNLINEVTFNMDIGEESSDLTEVIENILYVLVPILSIVFILGIIVRCKKRNVLRLRYSTSISNLKTTSSSNELEMLNESSSSSTRIISSLV